MVWIAGSSRAGYDYPGVWDRTVLVHVDNPEIFVDESSVPGGLECPFVPAGDIVEGYITVEVLTNG